MQTPTPPLPLPLAHRSSSSLSRAHDSLSKRAAGSNGESNDGWDRSPTSACLTRRPHVPPLCPLCPPAASAPRPHSPTPHSFTVHLALPPSHQCRAFPQPPLPASRRPVRAPSPSPPSPPPLQRHHGRSRSRRCRQRVSIRQVHDQRIGGVHVRTHHWTLLGVPQDQQTDQRTQLCTAHQVRSHRHACTCSHKHKHAGVHPMLRRHIRAGASSLCIGFSILFRSLFCVCVCAETWLPTRD